MDDGVGDCDDVDVIVGEALLEAVGDMLGDVDGVCDGEMAVQTSPAKVDTSVFRVEKLLTWL